MYEWLKKYFLYFILLFNPICLSASATDSTLFVFDIKGEINASTERLTRRALQQASESNAQLIVIRLDTYGGRVDAADEIRNMLLACEIPVWVYIENNAASAGAYISIACDSIYMRPGSTMGATTVVNERGEKVEEKYQSFMRSRMRSTAEKNGRNPDIAEAMVEWTRPIPGFRDSGKVVSLTALEAVEYGFCDGLYPSFDDLIKQEGWEHATLVEYHTTPAQTVIDFLLSPVVSVILIAIIVLAVFFELKTPGLGMGSVVALIAASLYFIPHYMGGLAAYWEILLFVLGLILVLVEIFLIPGTGAAGILGGVSIFISLAFALVKSSPGDGFFGLPATEDILWAFMLVLISCSSSFVFILAFGKKLLHSSMFKRVEVAAVQNKHDGFTSHHIPAGIIGEVGVVTGMLKPTGNVRIGDEIYEARAIFGTIARGEKVKVTGIENFTLLVKLL